MKLLPLLFTILYFLHIPLFFAQNKRKIDSLESLFRTTRADTSRIDILNKLSINHYNFDLDKAAGYNKEAMAIAGKIKDKRRVAYCEKTYADILFYKGENKRAEELYCKVINTMRILQDHKGLAGALYGLGYLLQENGKIPEAVRHYQQAITAYEKANDKSGAAWALVQIGVVLTNDNQPDQALVYLNKSLKVFQELKEPVSIANNYARIGNVLTDQKKADEAIKIYGKSLEIFSSIGHKRGIGVIYNNLAGVYSDLLNNIPLAIEYYEKALKLRTEIGDKNGVVIILSNLSSLYSGMRNFQKALDYIDRSNKMAVEIGFKSIIADNYKHLAILESRQGNYKKAFGNYVKYHSLNDSIFNSEKSKLVAEMNTKFETEKKEKEIAVLNQQKTQQALELSTKKEQIRKQRYFIAGILIVLVSIVLVAVLILRLYKQKKKANEIILAKNIELEQANEEIMTQRDEITAQRDMVTHQKEQIEEIHAELTDSIHYAERIQKAVLPSAENFIQKCPFEYFILYKPKDIVGGDFYFIDNRKGFLLIAVADCTGHGVPGGFMSMLGFSFLQEIVAKDEVQTAAQVLDELRGYVIGSLQQKGIDREQKDGMDMAFCVIDTRTLEMQFAGANNPVWVVPVCHGKPPQLEELRPDKMPIGIHERMNPFKNNIYQLQKGDFIYLMSDGYEDQFGGPRRKKFYAKNLKNLLLSNCQLPMASQKQILEQTIQDWIGEGDQIDDITIFGIKI